MSQSPNRHHWQQGMSPWGATRLGQLCRDLEQVADMHGVGDEGKALLAKAREYVEALAAAGTAQGYAKERRKSIERSRQNKAKRAAMLRAAKERAEYRRIEGKQ